MSTWILDPGLPLFIIGLAAAWAILAVWRANRRQRQRIAARGLGGGHICVIVNPIKPADYPAFRTMVDEACLAATGRGPQWFETSPDDPGTGLALQALGQKPSLIIVAGGDGTLRAVAAAVAHSGVPLGILPVGTGNLSARNLRLPLDLPAALAVCLSGSNHVIDLAWLRMDQVESAPTLPAEGMLLARGNARHVRPLPPGRNEPRPDEYAYLVIAGLGFDGETMANTSPRLKRIVGWTAYVFSALKALRIERMQATMRLYSPGLERDYAAWTRALPGRLVESIDNTNTIDEGNPLIEVRRARQDMFESTLHARTILFANCGELPFVTLAPDAKMDDGALDVIAIDTKGGLVGWSNLAVKIFGQGIGVRPLNTAIDTGMIAFQQVQRAEVQTDRPYQVQVDGDALGSARWVMARIDAGAIVVRVPAEAAPLQ